MLCASLEDRSHNLFVELEHGSIYLSLRVMD
jgi:hypothetical protein